MTGACVKTGYLHIDGNEALGREAAVPHTWVVGLGAVILAQWLMWQASALIPLISVWVAPFLVFDLSVTPAYVVSNLFYLVVPTAIFAMLALHFVRRIDGRSAKAIGLDRATAPLMLVWTALGLIAAIPHIVVLLLRQPGLDFLTGFATLVPVTIIQAGAEEILFRGVILGFLCARYGARVGILISALLFGFWHVYIGQPPEDAIVQFVATFVFGVTAGVITLHFANLGPALGLHLIWNVSVYLSGAAMVGDEFWQSWVSTFTAPWTTEQVYDGTIVRMLIIPLAIESLLVLAACRETVTRLLEAPAAPAAD